MGPHQATMDLVDKLRGYRGRLTRMQLCAAVGLDPANKYHFKRVHQLCRDFDITTADPGRVDPLAHKTPKRLMAAEMSAAKQALANEIARAKLERQWAPPYRGGDMDW